MTVKRFIPLLALAAAQLAPAQSAPCVTKNCYTASTGPVALAGTSTAATLQQPAAGPFQQVRGVKATVQCSSACVATRTTGGMAATATAAQTKIVQSPAQPSGYAAPRFLFFTASNATGGTVIDVVSIGAGGMQPYDLTDVSLGGTPAQTYTISVAAATGSTVNITYYVTAE